MLQMVSRMEEKMTIIVQNLERGFSLVYKLSDFLGHSYPTTHVPTYQWALLMWEWMHPS